MNPRTLAAFGLFITLAQLVSPAFSQPPPPPPPPGNVAYSNFDGFFAVHDAADPNVVCVFPPSDEVTSPGQQKVWKFKVASDGSANIDGYAAFKFKSASMTPFYLAFSKQTIGTRAVSNPSNPGEIPLQYSVWAMWYSFDGTDWKRWRTNTGTQANKYGTFNPPLITQGF